MPGTDQLGTTTERSSLQKSGNMMKTRTAHGLAAALSAVALLTATASQVSAAEVTQTATRHSDPAATPATYANYLRHSGEDGAADALKKFQRLTPTEQAKFIGYLHDPALYKSFLDKAAEQGKSLSVRSRNTNSTTSLRKGDVVMGHESTISGTAAAAARPLPSGNHTVTYTTYVKFLGIKVIKLSLWENFHSNGRDITKVNYADAGKTNITGVISISKSTPKKVLSGWRWCPLGGHCSSGHDADASVIWEGGVLIRGSNWQFDKKQWMRADIYGKLVNSSLQNV
ncbi:hypothetical protein [Streptomyces sp. NPDC127038]|uniref:hypothetical protein n=1 Tax=Streptomyces sp. NPDC127038 TaxID=3347114 RepID=UPI00364C4B4E